MQTVIDIATVVLGYLLGSIPFGLLIVKIKTGKDLRSVESGRTGGTNAMRAAGFSAGLLTATMDVLKGAAAVWLAQALNPESNLIHILAPIAAILGHNYSIFLVERDKNGQWHFREARVARPRLAARWDFGGLCYRLCFLLAHWYFSHWASRQLQHWPLHYS